MDRIKFKSLCKEDQEIVFDEMYKLYNLMSDHPITYEDLKICAEWISWIGCHGKGLEKRLNGFYPGKWLNEDVDIEKAIAYSDEAVRFVTQWNKILKNYQETVKIHKEYIDVLEKVYNQYHQKG